MKPQHITHATDLTGWPVVGVRMSNAPERTAWLYLEDFERITRKYPGSWSVVNAREPNSYVRIMDGKRTVYVGRLVAHAPDGTSVVYHDEDRLNLRGANLGLARGSGGVRKRTRATVRSPFTTRGGARV